MPNGTCAAYLTKCIAKGLSCGRSNKTLAPDIADGLFKTPVQVPPKVYSWREVSMIWDKACLRIFFFLTVLSTVVFMTVLAVGGEMHSAH